jgi:hypothetical protein
VALLAIAAAALANGLTYWVNCDDAFIAFRYAENLSKGLGLVFNEGERVEGYTDFLWVVLLAFFRILGADTPTTAQVLGAVAGVGVIPILYWAGRRCFFLGSWAALLPCCIVAASASVAMWMGGGLETALYMTLFTWAMSLSHLEMRDNAVIPFSGLAFALAALARPEAAGLFTVCCGYALVLRQAQPRVVLKMGIGFVLLFIPHFIFRLIYYGHPFPNTFYAKMQLSEAVFVEGLDYFGGFLLAHGPWALVALAGLFVDSGNLRRVRTLLPATVLGAAGTYIVLVGGDFYPYWRFCVPYLPWFALLLVAGAWRLGERLQRRFHNSSDNHRFIPLLAALLTAASVMIPAKLLPDLEYGWWHQTTPARIILEDFGNWLRRNRPPETVIAIGSLGRVPYYSGLRTIDILGLTDLHIAHRRWTWFEAPSAISGTTRNIFFPSDPTSWPSSSRDVLLISTPPGIFIQRKSTR